jgi:hypothetical protein
MGPDCFANGALACRMLLESALGKLDVGTASVMATYVGLVSNGTLSGAWLGGPKLLPTMAIVTPTLATLTLPEDSSSQASRSNSEDGKSVYGHDG